MRKKELSAIFASFLMAGTVLTACSTSDKPASEGAGRENTRTNGK